MILKILCIKNIKFLFVGVTKNYYIKKIKKNQIEKNIYLEQHYFIYFYYSFLLRIFYILFLFNYYYIKKSLHLIYIQIFTYI